MKWYLIIFICISLVISDVEQLFMYLLVTYISRLEKYLFEYFAHFFPTLLRYNWYKKTAHNLCIQFGKFVHFIIGLCGFLLSCRSSLYILDINPLSDT